MRTFNRDQTFNFLSDKHLDCPVRSFHKDKTGHLIETGRLIKMECVMEGGYLTFSFGFQRNKNSRNDHSLLTLYAMKTC